MGELGRFYLLKIWIMNNTDKNFPVFSRSESKKFSNEYFLNKIKNNYELVLDFTLNTNNNVQKVVNNNENFYNQAIKAKEIAITPDDLIKKYNSFNNSLNNSTITDSININNNESTNISIDTSTENNSLLNKYLNKDLSLPYLNDGDDNSNYLKDDSDLLEDLLETVSNDKDLINEKDSLDQLNQENENKDDFLSLDDLDSLEDVNDYLDDNKDEYSLEDDLGSKYSLETFESDNLSNLLDSYNIKGNLNSKNLPDNFFNYISKNRIREIVIEKLGYCDEDMLDELHSISIVENWKDLDVQKWLLNPENINKFKEVDINIEDDNSNIELATNKNIEIQTDTIDPIFKSSELDNKFFDFNVSDIKDANNKLLNNVSKLNNIESAESVNQEINKQNVKEIPQPLFNESQNLINSHPHVETENSVSTSSNTKCNANCDHNVVSNNHHTHKHEFVCNAATHTFCNHENNRDQSYLYREINSKQNSLEKDLSYKFDLLSNELKKLSGDFKANMIEELYRNLLINNQTETLKNYISDKFFNISSLFGWNSNNVNRHSNFNLFDNFPKSNNESNEFENESSNKIDELMNNKISGINSKFKNLEQYNQTKFDEINDSLKKIIEQINNSQNPINSNSDSTKEISISSSLENSSEINTPISAIDNNANINKTEDFNKGLETTIVSSSTNYEYKPDVKIEFKSNDIKQDELIKLSEQSVLFDTSLVDFEQEESLLNIQPIELVDQKDNLGEELIEEELNDEVLKLPNIELINHENKYKSLLNVEPIKFNEFVENKDEEINEEKPNDSNDSIEENTNDLITNEPIEETPVKTIKSNLKKDEILNNEVLILPSTKLVNHENKYKSYIYVDPIEFIEEEIEEVVSNDVIEEPNDEILELVNTELVNYENKHKSLINIEPIEFIETKDISENKDFIESNEILENTNNELVNFENVYKSLIEPTQSNNQSKEINLIKENNQSVLSSKNENIIEDNYFQNILEQANKVIDEKINIQTSELIQTKEKNNDEYSSNDIMDFFSTNEKNNDVQLDSSLNNIDTIDNDNLTNEKESLKMANSNYNQLLDSEKIEEDSKKNIEISSIEEERKKQKQAITEEMLNDNEEKISNWKENILNELEDVIIDLRGLNIRDDSIYDIENLKTKFKNI